MRRIVLGAGIAVGLVVAAVLVYQIGTETGDSGGSTAHPLDRSDGAPDVVTLRGTPDATTPTRPTPKGDLALGGRVIDHEENAVPGMRVGLQRTGPGPWDRKDTSTWSRAREEASVAAGFGWIDDPWKDAAFDPAWEVVSDEEGRFAFEGLATGQYLLLALPEPPGVSSRLIPFLGSRSREDLTLQVLAGVALRGRVVDRAGAGVAAVVTGTFLPSKPHRFEAPPVATDPEDGSFTFPALMEGSWRLNVVAPGRRQLTCIPVEVPYDGVFTIVLDAGDGTVAGCVTDEAGDGVDGADVLVEVETTAPAARLEVRGRTGEDGRYRLAAVPPGPILRVIVQHEGYLRYIAFPPEAPWSGAAAAPAEITTIDVTLRQGARLDGRVLEQDTGLPLAGVEVYLLESRGAGTLLMPYTTVSDAAGKYRFEDLPPGKRVLMARSPTHYLPQVHAPRAPGMRNEEDGTYVTSGPPEELLVLIAEGDTAISRDLRLARGLTVRGRVIGPDGEPVAGAEVHSRDRRFLHNPWHWGAHWPGWNLPLAKSVEDGGFVIANLPPLDAFVLYASRAPYLPVDSEPFSLTAGSSPQSVTLRLRHGAIVEGRLLDASGQGLRGTIRCTSAEAPPTPGSSTRTEEDGRFRVEGVTPGRVTITARVRGRGARRVTLESPLDPGETRTGVEIRMPAGERVSGVLVDEQGKPQARIGLMIRSFEPGGGSVNVRTNETGRFVCEHAPPGKLRISWGRWVGGRWHVIDLGDVFDAPAENLHLVLPCRKLAVVEGRVLDPHGDPVPLCRVRVRSIAPEASEDARPRSYPSENLSEVTNGAFRREVDGDPPYEVSVTTPRDARGKPLNLRPTKLEVTDPAAGPVEIRLEAGREIKGRVIDEEETAVEGVTVHCGSVLARSAADGSFRLGGLDDGPLRIQVETPPTFAQPHPLTIDADESEIVVTLIRATCVAGRVLMASGEAPPGRIGIDVTVPATEYGPSVTQWAEAPGGAFRVQGILPGMTVTLRVQVWGDTGESWPPISLEVAAGTENVEVIVGSGATLAGAIIDAKGTPVANAQFLLQCEAPGRRRSVGQYSCGPDGRFRVNGVEPGPYLLLVMSYDGSRARCARHIEVPAGDLRIAARESTPIEGRVTGGGDLGGFEVRAYVPGYPTLDLGVHASTAADGTFRLDGVDAPELELRVWKKDDDRYARVGPLARGRREVTLPLRPGEPLGGTILRPDGRVPKRAWVIVSSAAWGGFAWIDADGRFLVRGLPPGTYRVKAMTVHGPLGEVEVSAGRLDLHFVAP